MNLHCFVSFFLLVIAVNGAPKAKPDPKGKPQMALIFNGMGGMGPGMGGMGLGMGGGMYGGYGLGNAYGGYGLGHAYGGYGYGFENGCCLGKCCSSCCHCRC